MSRLKGDPDLLHALEVLSVSINDIMEQHADLGASPPVDSYSDLGLRLDQAGQDITALAKAMRVLAQMASA